MRRPLFAAIGLGVLVACSSGDDAAPVEALDGSASSDDGGGATDARSTTAPDAAVDARVDAAPGAEFSGEATYYAATGAGTISWSPP